MSSNLPSDNATPVNSPVDRVNPLKEAAQKVGLAAGAIVGVIGALVSYGVLSVAQGDALTAVAAAAQDTTTAAGTVVGGFIPLIAAVVAAFTTTSAAKDHVTPVKDPRNDAGQALTPAAVPAVTDPAPAVAEAQRAAKRQRAEGGVVGDGDTWTS